MKRLWLKLFGTAMAAMVTSAAYGAPKYRVEDLGPVPGGTGECYAMGINQQGTVVGQSTLNSGVKPTTVATLWRVGESAVDIGRLSPDNRLNVARAVNASGQVVGISGVSGNRERGFLWSETLGMSDLGSILPVPSRTGAQAINELGEVAGYSLVTKGHLHAFFWNSEVGMIDIGALSGKRSRNHSVASAINDNGEVVGFSLTERGAYHAFRWSLATGIEDLGAMSRTSQNFPMAINAKGKIVGYDIGQVFGAYILNPGHKMRALASLPGQNNGMAFSINSSDVVVGRVQIGTATLGTIWENPATVLLLDDLVDPADPLKGTVTINEAISINDVGQIAANGMIGGLQRALRLTPVP